MDCRSACWPSCANGVRPRAARSVPNASRQGVQDADQRYSGASCWPVRRRRSASSGSSVPPPRRAIGAHHCAEASLCISPRPKMRATVCQTYHFADAAGRNCSGHPVPILASSCQDCTSQPPPAGSLNERAVRWNSHQRGSRCLPQGGTTYGLSSSSQWPDSSLSLGGTWSFRRTELDRWTAARIGTQDKYTPNKGKS